jgi:rhamnopyranosyl-N-acetylglucosaminyl-diphospho-decaprenol beta-1,3/1,4-galactofuranosyltransferase
MKQVLAIIVTFRRAKILQDCLDHLIGQQVSGLKAIHVIINSDDAETLEVVSDFNLVHNNILTYELQENVGPAGGFHNGLKKFTESTFDFVWLMDDDIIVKPCSLKELLSHTDKYEYIYPTVLKKSGEEVISYGWWGVLLSRELVLRAGLPLKELFYWAEDTEYLQNRLIRVYSYKVYRSKTAIVEHLHHRGVHIPSWHYYYKVRNTLFYRIYIQKNNLRGRIKKTCILFLYVFYKIIVKEKDKFEKGKLVLLGTYHGIRGKLGKLVDPKMHA